jgi:hypothetical protein
MSLAHLMVPRFPRTRTVSAKQAPPARSAAGGTAFCGASREPIYRTLNEAAESGLEVCASCLLDARKPRKDL